MPSKIALILCSMFVIAMLRYDRRMALEVSLASWIPTMWMLIVVSKPLGVWFYLFGVSISGGQTLEQGSPVDRIFLYFCLFSGLLILLKRNFIWSDAIKKNFWLFIILFYMLFSGLYSDIPFISLKRWARELIAVVMAFVLASEADPKEALESLFRRIVYICIPFSYLFIHYFGEFGRVYVHNEGILMWTGVTLHKNSLLQLCIFSIIFLLWSLNKRKNKRNIVAIKYLSSLEIFIIFITFMIMGGPFHSLTYSATSTVALILGLTWLSWLIFKRHKDYLPNKTVIIAIVVFIIIYGTITPMIGKLSLIDVSSALGRQESITGRDFIWGKLVPLALNKPILGYGYGGFWTTSMRELSTVTQAHNGYLDILLNMGFFGLFLYSLFFIFYCIKVQRVLKYNYDYGVLQVCFLIMILVHNIAETSIVSFANFLMAILTFQTIIIPDS